MPYWNTYVVSSACGFTVALTVAPVDVTPATAPVATLGLAGTPGVVNVLSSPLSEPAALVAVRR